jgi:hypothetical protein
VLGGLGLAGLALGAVSGAACRMDASSRDRDHPQLIRLFPRLLSPAPRFDGEIYASPLMVPTRGRNHVILATAKGVIAAVDPESRAVVWTVRLPAPPGQVPYLLATPVVVKEKLVTAYQTVSVTPETARNPRSPPDGPRKSHRVAVVDLMKGRLDPGYPAVELRAEKSTIDGSAPVTFDPARALSRAALTHQRGYVYVSFGNLADVQPWHGWVFELDLAAWQAKGPSAAVSAVLVTTPESRCGPEGTSGSSDTLCGGGVWAHAGPQAYPVAEGFELLVPTGNGQLDLRRRDYANTLMRLGPGLGFEPGCDERLCANFDPLNPSRACMASCRNLFIPRLLPGDPPFRPASGGCADKGFWGCLAAQDYDLGGSSPVKVHLSGDRMVYVQPGKEGAVYLIDAEHMGTLYDREQVVGICGSAQDPCQRAWKGSIMTQPALTRIDDTPVVLIATYMPDSTHPAGLVALKIVVDNGRPRFAPFWQAPSFSSREALVHFRSQPTRVAISDFEGEPHAWVVDAYPYREGSTIFGVRVRDGVIVVRTRMTGRVRRNILPLVHDSVLYVPAYDGEGGSWLEAYAFRQGG